MSKATLEEADKALEIASSIYPTLHGLEPQIQGAILADLVSKFLAGHHPHIRESVRLRLNEAILKMIPAQDVFWEEDAPKH